MRIAQIAPLHEAVPPLLYGGTERVVSYLTDALVDLGHEVTLFASADSHTKATLEPVWPRALRLDPTILDVIAPHMVMLETVRQVAQQFDVIHSHLGYLPFSLLSEIDVPFLTTLHGRLDLPELQPVFTAFPAAPVISISDSQRLPLPQADWLNTIYHGLPEDLLTPIDLKKPAYLAFLGRVSPEKGLDAAITIAVESRMPLKIAAKVDKVDYDYFKATIEPLLSLPNIEFIGEIPEGQKAEFLSGAKALLFPINWSEPFGLVMIEAMACGTPVIAFNRGSVPEVVDHGLTGYICDDIAGAICALKHLDELSRDEIRARFECRFSAKVMAQHYVDAYAAVSQRAAVIPALRAASG
jgi:glycosyltransferase involved in cell wall biosynthesis